jgi:hypothetical protein
MTHLSKQQNEGHRQDDSHDGVHKSVQEDGLQNQEIFLLKAHEEELPKRKLLQDRTVI